MSIFRGGSNHHAPLAWFCTDRPGLADYKLQGPGGLPQKDVYLTVEDGVVWCVPPPSRSERRGRLVGISVFRTLETAQENLKNLPYVYEYAEHSINHPSLELRWDPPRPGAPEGHGVIRVVRCIPAGQLIDFLGHVEPLRRHLLTPAPLPSADAVVADVAISAPPAERGVLLG